MSLADRAARALRLPAVTGRVDQQPLTEQVEDAVQESEIRRRLDKVAREFNNERGEAR